MAKKQTRRSISVSRTTYERLKSFCETNGVSMSQFVETRVGDFLGGDATPPAPAPTPAPMRAMSAPPPRAVQPSHAAGHASQASHAAPVRPAAPAPAPRPAPQPMTSAAARYAVEPQAPIIKRAESTAPKAPTMPKANEIFTF